MKNYLLGLCAVAMLTFDACKSKDSGAPLPTPSDSTIVLSGDITTDMKIEKGKKYLLKGFVFVKNGATLTIDKGSIIKGDKASKGTLVITRGAKIYANGTATEPIVFTSAIPAGGRREGDWGGIILLGKAPINQAGSEATIEGGLTPTPNGTGVEKDYIGYGGTDVNDNSGMLKYVRIEFAGIAYSPDNEINALTMAGVGAGTTISYVQVYRSGDDSYEWFGGTVNCDHLVSTYAWDDNWDTDNGYSGQVQFGLSHSAKTIADQSGSNGFESDNDANGSTNTPQTKAVFSNMTIVGPIAKKNASSNPTSGINANFQHAAQIRRNSTLSIFNSLLIGFPIGLYIDDTKGAATSNNIVNGTLQFKHNIIAGCAIDTKFSAAYSAAGSQWFAASGNSIIDSAQNVMLTDAYKFSPAVSSTVGVPSFLLKMGSPAQSGASFMGLSGFQTVTYRGAFDGSNDWTLGWTNWAAEATEY